MGELEGLFGGLRADVEALLLQAPSVNLDALGGGLAGLHVRLEEQVRSAPGQQALCSTSYAAFCPVDGVVSASAIVRCRHLAASARGRVCRGDRAW